MTKEIELAKQHGIKYRLTPEGTTEMWCHDRDLQAFAEALVAAERARDRQPHGYPPVQMREVSALCASLSGYGHADCGACGGAGKSNKP